MRNKRIIKPLIAVALMALLGTLTILAFNFLFSNLTLVIKVLLIMCLASCICERVQRIFKK